METKQNGTDQPQELDSNLQPVKPRQEQPAKRHPSGFAITIGICCIIGAIGLCSGLYFQNATRTLPSGNSRNSNAYVNSENANSNAASKNSNQNAAPTAAEPAAPAPMSIVDYKNAVVKSSEEISNAIAQGTEAGTSGDVSRARDAQAKLDAAKDNLLALVPPAGYEEINNKYRAMASSAGFAGGYLVGVASAVQTGDDSLRDYYAGLANEEVETIAHLNEEIAGLLAAK